MEEPIRFRAGEIALAGTLALPDVPPPEPRRRYPGVLLLPSYFPRNRDGALDAHRHAGWFAPPRGDAPPGLLARVADALATLGVASVRYDKRGCGESEGSWAESDWFTLVDDARDAIGFMRSRRDLDLARSGILGHGEGAAIALSVAIGDPAIGALTLVGAPARSFRDVLRRQVAARRHEAPRHAFFVALDRWSEDIVERADRREPAFELRLPAGGHGADRPSVALNLDGWHQAFETPPLALATMLHRSVSLVHGAADTCVAPDEARVMEAALRGAGNGVDVRNVPGAGHDLAEAPDGVIAELATELAARLEPRALPPVLLAIEEMG